MSLFQVPEAPLITVKGLSRQVDRRWLWQGVSFSLAPGQTLGISGPSGSGKSLLLRTLVHLDPIQSGEILVRQKSLHRWEMPRLRQQVIYLPQQPAILEGTVEDNIQAMFQLKIYRDRSYSRPTVMADLAKFNRGKVFLKRAAQHLSGGERQILAVVRAIQLHPTLLLLDEPTSALDPETTQDFEALIQHWVLDGPERGYLWISHDPEQMKRMTQTQLSLSDFSL